MKTPSRRAHLVALVRGAAMALAVLAPVELAARIIIVEVHYHPAGSDADAEAFEFVELFNDEPLSFDISDYRLEGGITFSFPKGTVVDAHGVVVVTKNPEALAARYSIENALGPFEGRLGNGGDDVRLIDTAQATVSRMGYNDRGRWPAAADGVGPSLVLRGPLMDPGESESWGWSPVPGGTPGVVSFETAVSEVVLNEVERSSAGGWVELFNPSPLLEVDLSAYRVQADVEGLVSYTFPEGVTLAPRGFLMLEAAQLGFALDPENQRLFVVAPDGERVVDGRRFEARPAEGSDGRYPAGGDRWLRLDSPSPSATNPPPSTAPIVISEIHYHPYSAEGSGDGSAGDAHEFVEITNTGKEVVSLDGYAFTSGIAYDFPPGSEIAPGEYQVVAKDPDALTQDHAIPGVLGPYDLVLSNSGEMLRLSDGSGNPVDEVRYYDEGTWPRWPDGDGPSLELVDLRQDNSVGSAWRESEHTEASGWGQYEYTAVKTSAHEVEIDDSEFHLFLMGRGEVLVDDIAVVPAAGGENHVPGGSFDGKDPLAGWLIEGTHIESRVEPGAGPDGSNALRIIASKRGDTRVNRIEVQTEPALVDGESYTVRFKARWLRGADLLMTRSWNHGIAQATRLEVPPLGGTPGRSNSRALENTGPVLSGLEQSPVLPGAGEPLTVRVRVSDPDGVASVVLMARLDGEEGFEPVELVDDGTGADSLANDGEYAGVIELAASSGAIGEFYVEARDGVGLTRLFPEAAPGITFLFQYDDEIPAHEIPAYRLVLRERDYAELQDRPAFSNQLLPATLIYRDEQVFHDVGVRYRGSAFWRAEAESGNGGERRSFRVRLSDEEPLRSLVRLVLDDQAPDPAYQIERVVRGLFSGAGGIPYAERRHIQVILRGRSFGPYEEVEAMDPLFLQRVFGKESAGGSLYKADNHYEITDDLGQERKRRSWRYTDDKEQLRLNNKKRSHEQEDDFSDLIELLELMDLERTSNEVFDARAPELLDLENWIKTIAVLRAAGDWDAFGGQTAKNFYLYHHPDGRWRVIPWDHDVALDAFSWLSAIRTDPTDYLYTPYHPEIERLLRRPRLDRRFNAEVLRVLEEGFDPAVVHPALDEAWELLTSSGTLETCPPNDFYGRPCLVGPRNIKDFMAARRDHLLRTISNALTFTIETNEGQPFSAFETPVVLRGKAPLKVETVLLANTPADVRWVDKNTWELDVSLAAGANDVSLAGLDADGSVVGTASTEVTLVGALRFLRGDCDGDGVVGGTVTDAIVLLGFNFLGGEEPPCLAACDANGDGAVRGTVDDAIYLLNFSFQGGAPPAAPYPDCGTASEADRLLACRRPPENCNPDVVLSEPFHPGPVDPWTSTDVGEVSAAGGARLEDGCLSILGAEGALSRGGDDALHYVHREVSGDFRFTARLRDWTPVGTGSRAALMVRESLAARGRHASVMLVKLTNDLLHEFVERRSHSATSITRTSSGESYTTLDLWLQLEREGDEVRGLLSADGKTWTEPDTVTIRDLSRSVFVGFVALESPSEGLRSYGVATFCDFSIEDL